MPKVAVVTGANSGIGRSTSLLLAEHGYQVFATMRALSRGNKLRELAADRNLEVHEVELDVSETDSVNDGFKSILSQTDQIDVLINNAGVGSNASVSAGGVPWHAGRIAPERTMEPMR